MPKAILTEDVVVLRKQGWSMYQIARKFDVSAVAVFNYLKRHGYTEQLGRVDRAEGACMICGEVRKLDADHDHETNTERGMLCRDCNAGLGHFRDDPKRLHAAIDYLARYREV